MTQRFTVDLEMTCVCRATVEVVAADITEARLKALDKAHKTDDVWTLDKGAQHVVRIKAHATAPSLRVVEP
jgi:hypothetical protein